MLGPSLLLVLKAVLESVNSLGFARISPKSFARSCRYAASLAPRLKPLVSASPDDVAGKPGSGHL